MKKTVLITGASKGIGRATAIEFAKNNYNVIINYNNSKEDALKTKKLVDNYSNDSLIVKADISKEDEVIKMIDEIINKYGKIDVLVNNAGIAIDDEFFDHTINNFKKVIDTNLIGMFCVSKHVSKYMLKAKQGTIINIASNNGIEQYSPISLDYDASKAGVISLTHNLAIALAPNIKVNAVAPGWTKTESVMEMSPQYLEEEQNKIMLQRFAEPEEIAKVIYFLASDDASYINNSIIRVDGGCRNG